MVPDEFTAEDPRRTQAAQALCGACSFQTSCRDQMKAAVSQGEAPRSRVVAAVAFDHRGLPDPRIHQNWPAWLPKPSKRCDTDPALFESAEPNSRRAAVAACNDCFFLDQCRRESADMISMTGSYPIEIVLAAVAFTADGRPDKNIHGKNMPTWLPDATPVEDIDPIALERARHRDSSDKTLTLSPAEIRQLVLEESQRPNPSLENVRLAAGVHWRVVNDIAEKLGVKEKFQSKRRRAEQPLPHDDHSSSDAPLTLELDLAASR